MRLLARGLALMIMVLPGVTLPLGLGEIQINTALNQPLSAEIRLHSVRQDELEDMRVKIASEDAFKRAGIDRPYILNYLRFSPKLNRAGQAIIEITSNTPVREPFLNFLLEVQWPKGRLLREYTVLLDPPVMFEQADTVGIQPPVVESQSSSTSSLIKQPSNTTANESDYRRYSDGGLGQSQRSRSSQVDSQTYKTKTGDTLSEIAAELRPNEATSLPQMMIALLRANPESFIRGNINELMAGVIMRLPTDAELASVDRAWASAEVLRHNTLWRQYRSNLTASVPTKPSGELEQQLLSSGQDGQIEEIPGEQGSEGKATDGKLEILAADQNETSKASNPASDVEISKLREDVALARELAASRSAENEELNSKIKQLEEMLAQKERLINLQSEELATLQNRLMAVEEAKESVVAQVTDESSIIGQGVEPSGLEGVTDKEVMDVDTPSVADQNTTAFDESNAIIADSDATVARTNSNEQEVSAVESQEPAPTQIFEDNKTEITPLEAKVGDTPVVSETPLESTASDAQVVSDAQGEPLETLSFTEEVINRITANSMILTVIAGVGLLLAVLSWLLISRSRKVKKAAQDEVLNDQLGQPVDLLSPSESSDQQEGGSVDRGPGEAVGSPSELAATPEAGVDHEPQATAPNVNEQLETNRPTVAEDQDDTLTEADVYIAYNLHQQAEDLLKEAIARDPERDDYRVKLLENYCAAEDRESFDAVAGELQTRLSGTGQHWEQVLALASRISPEHPFLTSTELGDGSMSAVQTQPSESDGGSEPNEAQRMETDMVGDMGSGLLSELESEQGSESSTEDVSGDSLDFDLSDLDLSFQEDAGEMPETEVLDEQLADSNLLDFEFSDLDIDVSTGAEEDEDQQNVDSEGLSEIVDLVPSTSEDVLDDVVEEQPQDDAELALDGSITTDDALLEVVDPTHYDLQDHSEVSLDAEEAEIGLSAEDSDILETDTDSEEPIDESDIYTSDIEFEQTTNTVDLNEDVSIDGLSEESAVDEGLLISMDEVPTEVLTPLTDESSAADDFDLAVEDRAEALQEVPVEEDGMADLSAAGFDSDSGTQDRLEGELSADDVALDLGADDIAQAQPVDEASETRSEAEFDLLSELPSIESPSSQIGMEADEDASGLISEDLSNISEQGIDEIGSDPLAELESILKEIPDDQSALEQDSSNELDGMEHEPAKADDDHPQVDEEQIPEEQIVEGVVEGEDGTFEEIDVLGEVNTKLDLARAYIDMGDAEGARSALEEVLNQGDEEQRREAEGLLKQIA